MRLEKDEARIARFEGWRLTSCGSIGYNPANQSARRNLEWDVWQAPNSQRKHVDLSIGAARSGAGKERFGMDISQVILLRML